MTSAAGDPGGDGWQPALVALDIDGTLLKWVDGSGTTHEEIAPRVHSAVRRVVAAGAHVVLASGRSAHGMTRIADLLGLGSEDDPVWVVASNGAVVFRYPPLTVVHEETFDARARGRRRTGGTTRRPSWPSRSAGSATASTGTSPTVS